MTVADEQSKWILEKAIQAIEIGSKSSGPRRKGLIGSVRVMIADSHTRLSVAAFTDQKLDREARVSLNILSSIANLYVIALCDLAMDGSTQWDDDYLFVEQFKNAVRQAMSRSKTMDVETGKIT